MTYIESLQPSPGVPEVDPRAVPPLACPHCLGDLAYSAETVRCDRCGLGFPVFASGQLDLRPVAKTEYHVSATAPEPPTELPPASEALEPNPAPEVDWAGFPVPPHLSAELLSHIPRGAEGDWALDIGCGAARNRGSCQHAGYRYLGLDFTAPGAGVLADAHALPCRSQAFRLVLCFAVLEHLWQPLVALREARRVITDDGLFIGSVAFLEPYHRSYFHMSPLAVRCSLEQAGFEPLQVAANGVWTGLLAISNVNLFPRAPLWAASAAMAPAEWLSDAWWLAGRLTGRSRSKRRSSMPVAGSFLFIARPQ